MQGFMGTPYVPPRQQDQAPVPEVAEGYSVTNGTGATVEFGMVPPGYCWRVYRVTVGAAVPGRVQLHIGSLMNLPCSVVDNQQYAENADTMGYYVPAGQTFTVFFVNGTGHSAEYARIEYVETPA